MKNILLSLVLVFAGATTGAMENPWIRTCRIAAGQFWIVGGGANEMPLCFFGSAGVGAEAFFLLKTKTGSTEAVQAYQKRNFIGANSDSICEYFHAELLQARDSEGQTVKVCRFADHSLVEQQTLWLGPGATENKALDQALSTSY